MTHPTDPLRHPDLVELSRRLRLQLTQVLDAEQEAAAITLRRRSTIRDRLLNAEDRNEVIHVECVDGEMRSGRVEAVGIDHVILGGEEAIRYVAIPHIVSIEVQTL